MYAPASDDEIEAIFAKRLSGEGVTREEELKFKTAFMLFVGTEYTKRNWVMRFTMDANVTTTLRCSTALDRILDTTAQQLCTIF